MADKVRVGIIGIGFMGSTHYHIHNDNPKTEVTALADIDPRKRAGDWSSIVGNIGNFDNNNIDISDINVYEDGMQLINDPNVDMVDICVPTYLHKEYAVAALEAGKHVHVEKPVARNSKEAAEIVGAARNADGMFSVGMCVRFWPEYRHARELYCSGRLGKVISATFKRVSPSIKGNGWEDWYMKYDWSGGALLDLHLHDTDEILYFFGRPDSVTARGVKGIRSDCGVDHSITVYHFGDDNFYMSEGGWDPAGATPFEMSFQVVCEKATLRFSEAGYKVIWEDGTVEEPQPAQPGLETGWHVELNHFADCILKGENPRDYLTLQDVLDSISIVEAEQASIDQGGQTAEVCYY